MIITHNKLLKHPQKREDEPAIVFANGSKSWYKNGELHREDGPAIIYADGTKKWFINGELHRKNGPAIVYRDGTKKWFINGKLHREDGPAVTYTDGLKLWFLCGIEFPEEKFVLAGFILDFLKKHKNINLRSSFKILTKEMKYNDKK